MKNDGGPAFPQPLTNCKDVLYDPGEKLPELAGMSLRDYFAAKAMQSLTAILLEDAQVLTPEQSVTVLRSIVPMSFAIADAMLAERAKPHATPDPT